MTPSIVCHFLPFNLCILIYNIISINIINFFYYYSWQFPIIITFYNIIIFNFIITSIIILKNAINFIIISIYSFLLMLIIINTISIILKNYIIWLLLLWLLKIYILLILFYSLWLLSFDLDYLWRFKVTTKLTWDYIGK